MDIMELMDFAENAISRALKKKYRDNRFIDDVAWGETRFRLPIYEIGSSPMDCHGVTAFSFCVDEDSDDVKKDLTEALDYFIRYQL